MFKSDQTFRKLREASGLASLPDAIEITDVGEYGQPLRKPIGQATIDDIAFAIQALSDNCTAVYKRLDVLRQLHDRARRAGGLGAELAVEAALRIEDIGR